MHPQAREARMKDYEKNPDRMPVFMEEKSGFKMYPLKALNMIKTTDKIEFVSPDVCSKVAEEGSWFLVDPETCAVMNWVCDSHPCMLYTNYNLQDGTLIRIEDPEYKEGEFRDTGR